MRIERRTHPQKEIPKKYKKSYASLTEERLKLVILFERNRKYRDRSLHSFASKIRTLGSCKYQS